MVRMSDAPTYSTLAAQAEDMKHTHLRDLLNDEHRNDSMTAEFDGIFLDYCRQKLSVSALNNLFKLSEEMGLQKKIQGLFNGAILNPTENRAVLHTALRARADDKVFVDGKNIITDVHNVLNRIKRFAASVRSGEWTGYTGKPLKDVVCIGIGGSYLGPEFVYEALRTDAEAAEGAQGRRLRFLANVDPIDVKRALEGLHPETTLVVVISKTFTTAETMLNARTVRDWLLASLRNESAVSKHMVAISTNLSATSEFGINPANVFGFWDWVGGRYSVSSAVGVLPLALHFGWNIVNSFLEGARSMDEHFKNAPLRHNLPVILGLISVWNASFMGFSSNALLPYCQALLRFPAHIQQVSMESNGKRVTLQGEVVDYPTEQVYFGEPGTNGQHSFYQLLHQGQVVSAEFIGAATSQYNIHKASEPVSNHDELMANFFAQPDALAFGKTVEELMHERVPNALLAHKEFPGDRPSLSLLFPVINAKTVGQLLSLYEHRVAVQGFVWNVCPFDQWGVELGKVLAKQVRSFFQGAKRDNGDGPNFSGFHSATARLLHVYLTSQAKHSQR